MTTDDIDQILGSEDLLEPSAGFTNAVLEGVRRDAVDAAPLRFPWGRFATGLVACIAVASSAAVLLQRNESTLLVLVAPLTGAARELGLAAVSVLVGLGATRIPRLFARL